MNDITTSTVRFHEYGDPAEVLRLEQGEIPAPSPSHIRVKVDACGLNPADWALCQGLFPGSLPRGIGLEVSGTVEAVGEGVSDVSVGDAVLGLTDFAGAPSAGAAGYALLNHWTPRPAGLDPVQAAALPMAITVAHANLSALVKSGLKAGQTVVVHGAGSIIGFAAVQIAQHMGAKVIATAGNTYADRLRELGAQVTSYGEGMVERVRDLAGGTPDFILDTSPANGVLPDLLKIADGDTGRMLTIADFAAAAELGIPTSFTAGGVMRYDVLEEYAQRAAAGQFSIPVARTYPLADWREAMEVSRSGQARGKLVLLIQ